jgi:hypothetical protein
MNFTREQNERWFEEVEQPVLAQRRADLCDVDFPGIRYDSQPEFGISQPLQPGSYAR